jgi:hypothetical protein
MKPRLFAVAVLLAILVMGLVPSSPAQCAMCKTVLQGSPEGRSLSLSLDRAILLMFVAPYLVFGTFVAFAFRSRWQPALARARGRVWARLSGRVHAAS